MTPVRRAIIAAATALGVAIALIQPASAHGGPGGNNPPASNYQTTITDVSAEFPGVTWRMIEASNRIELINTGPIDIVVIDYDGKPYLRVGPDGVFENLYSAATYLNVDTTGNAPVPMEAFTSDVEPNWRKVSSEHSARWHDHRAHWMGGTDPPQVVADPGEFHQIIPTFTIPARVGDTPLEVTGNVAWVPGPSALPWLIAAAGLAIALGVLTWRLKVGFAIILIAVIAASGSIADFIGSWDLTAERGTSKIGEIASPIIIVGLTAFGISRRVRRRPDVESVAAITIAAVWAGVVLGFTRLGWFSSSQLPSGLSPTIAKLVTGTSLGIAIGSILVWPITWRMNLLLADKADNVEAEHEEPGAAGEAEAATGRPMPPVPARIAAHPVIASGVAATGLIALGALLAGAFASDPTNSASPTTGDATARPVVATICEAAAAAAAGDGPSARFMFEQKAHSDLHSLATAAASTDRAAAARLLEAKQRVEATVGAEVQILATNLEGLIEPTRRAASVAGWPVPDPCPKGR